MRNINVMLLVSSFMKIRTVKEYFTPGRKHVFVHVLCSFRPTWINVDTRVNDVHVMLLNKRVPDGVNCIPIGTLHVLRYGK
jgi:hypothetical protein